MQEPRTGRLVGYCRVSTKDQSVKQQVDALRSYGVQDDDMFIETVSGVSHRRPRLEEALAKCDPGDTFVVWKFDRFGRSLMDLLARMQYLKDNKIDFVSLTDQIDTSSPAGRLMMHVMAVIAEFERDLISERTRAGLQYKIEHEGYRPGPIPKLDGKPKEIDGEMLTPREFAQSMRDSFSTVREIQAALLEEYGIKVSIKTLYNQTVRPEPVDDEE